jgi:hypothetical protein
MKTQNAGTYPRLFAHHGAVELTPLNKLAVLRLNTHQGCRMFECDATPAGVLVRL